MKKACAFILIPLFSLLAAVNPCSWPPVSRESKPWVYWWWMGSAVDEANLSRHLHLYSQAGLGGVHIIPIYGVRGEEKRFLPFLSKPWLDQLAFTVREADRLGMGVDMTSGTGWPFGGPWVRPEDAAVQWRVEKLSSLQQAVKAGERIVAVDSAATGSYYVLLEKPTGMRVKRAAPGGEGWVMDYLSTQAVQKYLAHFDSALSSYVGPMPRAFYHDSFEASGCNGTDTFLQEFQKRRGYDLAVQLRALFGEGDKESADRVRCDFRETQAELLLDHFTRPWVQWAHRHKTITRNQAHGSPANLLDLYAVADIPETESFGSSLLPIPGLRIDSTVYRGFGKPDLLVNKFASSAAHVSGRRLVSSETCTWLAEHFKVSLSQVKPEVDRLLVAGINHIFFHGMTYSPADAGYPGWTFYASTQFDPYNPFWRDLPELDGYISRCQSFLQQGEADPDLLLYFPIHDAWSLKPGKGGQLRLQVHNPEEWLYDTEFHRTADRLQQQGYSFDYISDRQLQDVQQRNGMLVTKGCRSRALVIPACRYMPVETLAKIKALIRSGGQVVFCDRLPQDVPGLADLEKRRKAWRQIMDSAEMQGAQTNLESAFLRWNIRPEALASAGLSYVRRQLDRDRIYFIANLSSRVVEKWVALTTPFASVAQFDPLTKECGQLMPKNGRELYLHLKPGQSCILLASSQAGTAPALPQWQECGEAINLTGPWQARFLQGEPMVQPDSMTVFALCSWTGWPLQQCEAFSGAVRYETRFDKPSIPSRKWLLQLGKVCESARVSVNGKYLATCWSLPFECKIDDALLKAKDNLLSIEVVNLAANRIADLERRGVCWKKFYDINIVNTQYKPFDASHWPAMPSGLLGPVTLTALTERKNDGAEWIKRPDPVTGREVWQITSHDSASVAVYFERQPFTDDDHYLVFGSKRSGSWQLYRADLYNGELVRVSEKQDLSPSGFTIHPDGKSVCYIHDNILYKTDVKTLQEKVWMDFNGKFSTPLKFSSSFSADARYTLVTTQTDSGICLFRIDLENGLVHGFLWKNGTLSHPLINPTNPDLITFVPGPDTQDDMTLPMEKRARTWVYDVKTGQCKPFLIMPYGFRATHESWSADGKRFFFYKKTVPGWKPVSICSIDQDGGDWREYYCHQTIKLGHGISSQDGKWFLSDGQDPKNNPLILINLATGVATFLCWPNASMNEKAGQHGHVHPTLSRSGRFACYTSDVTGAAQVYVLATGLP